MTGRADAKGVHESTALLEGLIAREKDRGIDAEKIVIAGFSMGGAIAINTALHTKESLAGLMALSTYLPLPSEVADSADERDLPVFMAHGSFDPMLPMQWGQAYPMAHAVCPEEIRDIRAWLLKTYGVRTSG
jgi:phospholipase/carboxylesterase